MRESIQVGKLYKHFKGNIYKVVGFARHSETDEDMVLYQSQKNNELWVRPIAMWNEYLPEKQTTRFTLIED